MLCAFRRTRSSGRRASHRIRYCASSACRSTSAATSRWTSYSAPEATSTSGLSATALACQPDERAPGSPDEPACTPPGAAPREEHRRRPGALRLPDARPGCHARSVQRDRRRAGPPPPRLPRLVRDAPLLSRKLRVIADWTVSLLFRRDVVELGT